MSDLESRGQYSNLYMHDGDGYEPPFPQDICIDPVSIGGGLLDCDYLGDLYWGGWENNDTYYSYHDLRTPSPKEKK